MADAVIMKPGRSRKSQLANLVLIVVVAARYVATLTALFLMAKAGAQRAGETYPPQVLLVLACMALSVVSTGCYVLLRRGR